MSSYGNTARKRKGLRIIKDSRTRLWALGNPLLQTKTGEYEKLTWHSLDWNDTQDKNPTMEKGLARFHKWIAYWGKTCKEAHIYDADSGALLEKWKYGQLVEKNGSPAGGTLDLPTGEPDQPP